MSDKEKIWQGEYHPPIIFEIVDVFHLLYLHENLDGLLLGSVLKCFEDCARVLEGFPLEDGEGVVDVEGVAHAVEDACDALCARYGPEGFSRKRFLLFVFW